ncbi:hypothetical protein ACFE04_014506 [Oxalis oulophora]
MGVEMDNSPSKSSVTQSRRHGLAFDTPNTTYGLKNNRTTEFQFDDIDDILQSNKASDSRKYNTTNLPKSKRHHHRNSPFQEKPGSPESWLLGDGYTTDVFNAGFQPFHQSPEIKLTSSRSKRYTEDPFDINAKPSLHRSKHAEATEYSPSHSFIAEKFPYDQTFNPINSHDSPIFSNTGFGLAKSDSSPATGFDGIFRDPSRVVTHKEAPAANLYGQGSVNRDKKPVNSRKSEPEPEKQSNSVSEKEETTDDSNSYSNFLECNIAKDRTLEQKQTLETTASGEASSSSVKITNELCNIDEKEYNHGGGISNISQKGHEGKDNTELNLKSDTQVMMLESYVLQFLRVQKVKEIGVGVGDSDDDCRPSRPNSSSSITSSSDWKECDDDDDNGGGISPSPDDDAEIFTARRRTTTTFEITARNELVRPLTRLGGGSVGAEWTVVWWFDGAATTTSEWKRGWVLGSGRFADLCYTCGCAFENFIFCETYHSEEAGWRECYMCGKRLHCGCIASKSLLEFLDFGGVGCVGCSESSQLHSVDRTPNGFAAFAVNGNSNLLNRVTEDNADEGGLSQLCRIMEANEPNFQTQSDRHNPHESLAHTSLSMSLGGLPTGPSNFVAPFSAAVDDGREKNKAAPVFQQGQRSRPLLPKPSKFNNGGSSEANNGVAPQPRIGRQPVDGRGKSQLLPRYWPKITDQELEKISGDLNSTVVPLFEKILSASDAGRIGRLVLPKACAEAYFPPINQSDGLPLRVQDVQGNEWTFQFRFWPNNNSRMYVLEGVTQCIQTMQLRAGDTVIFSRIDPGGKLVLGFRRTSTEETQQEGQASANVNGESSVAAITEQPSARKYAGQPNSDNLNYGDGDFGWNNNHGGSFNVDNMLHNKFTSSEKKKARNISSKNKRMLMNNEEVLELRITWEEAQELLRPPSEKPNVVPVEDFEFEEYYEPPVIGKNTVFISQLAGDQEQWAQCDDCSKWRKLPFDALLGAKWTCAENAWDSSRASCSEEEEMSAKDLEILVRRDLKRRRIAESQRSAQEHEQSGLDALASAAVLGDIGDSGEPSAGVTTKHPRHRDGCSCIVCIQPPSGKGKHKPTCECNVCSTVKRRFATMMLRKNKKKQERAPKRSRKENANGHNDDEPELNGHAALHHINQLYSMRRREADLGETSAGQNQIDLNCDPDRDDMQVGVPGSNMMNLADAASIPLEAFVNQNRFGSLMSEPDAGMGSSSRTPEGQWGDRR